MSAESLRAKIREVPDFPKPGILFYDITTLIREPGRLPRGDRPDDRALPRRRDRRRGGHGVARLHLQRADGARPRRRASCRSASSASCPAETISVEYELEYGTNTLEVHRDAIAPGQRVLIVDDLLATGGTVLGTIDLVQQLKGEVVGLSFLVELAFLKGRDRLDGHRIHSVVTY